VSDASKSRVGSSWLLPVELGASKTARARRAPEHKPTVMGFVLVVRQCDIHETLDPASPNRALRAARDWNAREI